MTRTLTLFALSFVTLLSQPVIGQCTNGSQFPSNTIVPDPGGAVTSITNCSWQQEYSVIGGVVAGNAYQFTIADGSYITIHQDTYNGPVLGHGTSPVTVVATTNGNLFAHWNVDANCATAQNCMATTVQRFLDCMPPTVTYSTDNDCVNDQFSLFILVSDTGDASSLSLVYTVNGGGLTVVNDIGLGNTVLGPFPLGASINVTVAHADNAACNVSFTGITNLPCAIESCGPDNYTHCYGNSENYVVHYQGTSTSPLTLHFNSGGISPSGNDQLIIRDGLLLTDPILYTGVGNAGDLTGVTVVSTNPDHALTLSMTSNTSFSCADGGVSPEWDYTVGCLDCSPATAGAGTVEQNCDLGTYTVSVPISDMGSADTLYIYNDLGVPPTMVLGPGTYTAGPFSVNALATLHISGGNQLCDVALGSFGSVGCPVLIDCTGPLYSATYCYNNYDARSWLYQSSGGQPLALQFSAGVIENVAYDHLVIHDGTDATGPVLWQHLATANEPLAGISVVSTGPAIFMEMTSDNTVSCADGFLGAASTWEWTVGCMDCTNPTASYAVQGDCQHHRFYVDVNVSDLGTADSLRLVTSMSADTLDGIGLGNTTLGPFPIGESVTLTLLNSTNELCRINSPQLTYALDSCVILACDPTMTTDCYSNGDTTWYTYTSGMNVPISISFLAGDMLDGDQVQLYNGLDTTAQLVYAGNYGGNLTGLALTSSNLSNAITLLVISDGAGSCATGEATAALQWSVGCGLVGQAEHVAAHPSVYPVPTTGQLGVYWPAELAAPRAWRLVDMVGRTVANADPAQLNGTNWSLDLSGVSVGRYVLHVVSNAGTTALPVLVGR